MGGVGIRWSSAPGRELRSTYMGEASAENKEPDISVYEKVSPVPSDERGELAIGYR